MGALAMFSMFIIVQVAYSCIPAIQPSSKPDSTEVPSEPPTEEPTKTPTTAQKETTDKPDFLDCVTVDLNPGRTCVFPFIYQYHRHYECLPFKDKFWCALTPIYDKEEWGYCNQALCPPTKATTTTVANTSTPTSTTTSSTSTTPDLWETSSTSVHINLDEKHFLCDIHFKWLFKDIFTFKDIQASCEGSSTKESTIKILGIHKFSFQTQSSVELYCSIGAVLLNGKRSLSAEVMESTLQCEIVDSRCITLDGEMPLKPCIFPFNHEGRRFQACTDVNSPDPKRLWCPTQIDASDEALENEWGFCKKSCPYCAGSPLSKKRDDDFPQPCGLDCWISPDVESVDEPNLLPPRIVSQHGQANGVHKMNLQDYVIISCETQFYNEELRGERQVRAQCGPNQHEFTVYNDQGNYLPYTLERDQFRCDVCPGNFQYIDGSKTPIYHTVLGLVAASTVTGCFNNCNLNAQCTGFIYHFTHQECYLIQYFGHGSKIIPIDYVVCVNPGDLGPEKTSCLECGNCPPTEIDPEPEKDTRKPGGQGPEYFAEHYGYAILKTFQLLQAPAKQAVLKMYPVRHYQPSKPYSYAAWHSAATDLLALPVGTHVVYLYFYSQPSTGATTNDFTSPHGSTMFHSDEHDDYIPFYIGRTGRATTTPFQRYEEHFPSPTNVAYGKLFNDWKFAKTAITSKTKTPWIGDRQLFYTFVEVDNDFDTLIVERLFLDTFDFIHNKQDNFCRRDNPTPFATIIRKPSIALPLPFVAGVSVRLNVANEFKRVISHGLLKNTNRFFTFLYGVPFLGLPTPTPLPTTVAWDPIPALINHLP